jgi:hypothetical protein
MVLMIETDVGPNGSFNQMRSVIGNYDQLTWKFLKMFANNLVEEIKGERCYFVFSEKEL